MAFVGDVVGERQLMMTSYHWNHFWGNYWPFVRTRDTELRLLFRERLTLAWIIWWTNSRTACDSRRHEAHAMCLRGIDPDNSHRDMRGAHKANNRMWQAFGSPWRRRWMGWLEPVPRCSWWRHQMQTFSALLDFVQGIQRSSVNPVYIDGIVIIIMWPGMEKQYIQRCWYRILSCSVLEWLLYQFSQESRGPFGHSLHVTMTSMAIMAFQITDHSIVYSTISLGQHRWNLRNWALVRGIHFWPVDSRSGKHFHFMTSSRETEKILWIPHHITMTS